MNYEIWATRASLRNIKEQYNWTMRVLSAADH